MRARQRHFNPGSAGAMIALDSRFITGLSDNDLVSIWSDRSRNANNVSQSVDDNKPKYKTSQLNGNSVVRFDGNNDRLLRSDSGFPTGNLTIITVQKLSQSLPNGRGGVIFMYGQSNFGRMISFYYETNAAPGIDAFTFGQYGNGVWVSNVGTINAISCGYRNNSDYYMQINGARTQQKTMTTATTVYGVNGFSIGSTNASQNYASTLNGDICVVEIFNSNIASALRRRLEHAAALSFKIACS